MAKTLKIIKDAEEYKPGKFAQYSIKGFSLLSLEVIFSDISAPKAVTSRTVPQFFLVETVKGAEE